MLKIIVVHHICVCIHLSVTGGQWKQIDLETEDAVSLAIE